MGIVKITSGVLFKNALNLIFLEGDISMDIAGNKMRDFSNLVQIKADFSKAKVSTNDIKTYYKGFNDNIAFYLQGGMLGTFNDFNTRNLRVSALNNSKIQGDINFKNLLNNSKTTVIRGNYKEVTTSHDDLKQLMPKTLSVLPKELTKLGDISFEGEHQVTKTTLITKGVFVTALGDAEIDLTLLDYLDIEKANYKGEFALKKFDLGTLINDKKVGTTSINLEIDGNGFTQETLQTKLSGAITDVSYNGYNFHNIVVLGDLSAPKFNGELRVNDPNIKGNLKGLIDVSKEINNYNFKADIDHFNLNVLNIFNDSISLFKGTVVMDMKGSGVEDADGIINFNNTSFQTKEDTYFFNNFNITSTFDKKKVRTIAINSSDIVNGFIEGVFKLNEVIPLFKNAVGGLYTNYQPDKLTKNQFMNFDFVINNKIVEALAPEIHIEPNTIVKGSVSHDDSEFKLNFKSPRIEAYGKKASFVEIKVDTKNPLFNTYIAADSLDIGHYTVADFNLINVTLKDTLFMKSEFKGGLANKDTYDLSLYHTINSKGDSVLGFKKSNILFKNTSWFINEKDDSSNRVIFDNNFSDVLIESISLSHNDVRIDLKGNLKGSDYKDINALLTNVNLSEIAPEIDNLALEGVVNGKLDLLQRQGDYYPSSTITVNELSVNNNLLGVLDLNITGDKSLTTYSVSSTLKNKYLKSVKANGFILASGDEPVINLDVTFEDFDLKPFDAIGQGIISNIRGLASGKAKVIGNYKSPDINGALELKNAGLKIPYLNTDFDFIGNPIVTLTNQSFVFNDVPFKDIKHKTLGDISGVISHKDFSKWDLDLNISSDRLLVLDTQNEIDVLYYGTAFVKGIAHIKGPSDNLVIDVVAETEPGTVFNVPIDDSETLGDISYIHFLSPEEKKERIKGKTIGEGEIKGLSVNFDLDIDKDALIEIVVDKENGSVLKGSGAGLLLVELDTNGKFKMYGDFAVYDGVFVYKYGGIVQKEFKVREDSNIRWDGVPTEAQLEISAVYRAEANPSILLENPSINRKIPIDVIINLKEQLLKPDITFDIEFPNTSSNVASELTYRLNDRNTRELNAISLVSQGVFLSETSISTAAAVNNILETTSSVLSNILFSDDDSIFDVGLDLVQADKTPDLQSSGRVGFTLSTKITNRVLINGKVGVPTGGLSESIIVGDVEVDFLLNKEGNLRAKIFNKQSDIQFIGESEAYTQGAGISYSVDFSSFKELIKKIFDGKSKEAIRELSEKSISPSKTGL